MNLSHKHYDAVVIGAGPSGSSSAYFLAKHYEKVLLVDKALFPREKLCGGALSHKTQNLLKEFWNFNMDEEILGIQFNGADVYYGSKLQKRIVDKTMRFNMVMRSELDFALIHKAQNMGVEFIDGLPVRDVDARTGTVFFSDFSITADVVIIADGIPSSISKKIGLSRSEKSDIDRNAVLAYEIHISKSKLNDSKLLEMPRLYYGVVKQGYAWTFPKKDKLTVGILGMVDANTLREKFIQFLKLLRLDDIGKIKIKGHWLPYSLPKKKLSMERCFLVGDSAGFVDPVIGEGIYYALRSGQIIAESLIENHMNIPEAAKMYHKCCKKEMYREFQYGKILRKFMYNPLLLPLVMKALRVDKEFAIESMHLIQGNIEFSKFWWKMVRFSPRVIIKLIIK